MVLSAGSCFIVKVVHSIVFVYSVAPVAKYSSTIFVFLLIRSSMVFVSVSLDVILMTHSSASFLGRIFSFSNHFSSLNIVAANEIACFCLSGSFNKLIALYIAVIFSCVHRLVNGAVIPAALTASSVLVHHHRLVANFVAVSEFIVVVAEGGLNRFSITSLFCSRFLFSTQVSGACDATLARLPIPTLSLPSLNGMIGKVWRRFCQNDWTPPPIFSPSLFAFIAAKKTIRMSPIAKRLMISRENRSPASHRGNLVNSTDAMPQKLNASFPVCIGVIV